jgi:transitional endoplasmic reticulum ATPase
MKLSKEVDIEQLGKDTHGYVGADLSQLCMEAALLCVREELGNIDMDSDHVKQVLNNTYIYL